MAFLDQSTGDITSWLWDFDDGASSSSQNPFHVFNFPRGYDVTLTVTGPGGSDSTTLIGAVEVVPATNGVPGAPPSLSTLVVPMPADLGNFVQDMAAAERLGKALFWDMQLGSDGLTACASCHYHAGVDNRRRNTMHPGADGVFDQAASERGGGPNYVLNSGDFPFHKFLDPNTGERLIHHTDDRRGAAGVLNTVFEGTDSTMDADLGTSLPDGTFNVDGANTLRVTGRDAPTAIGAIFFHRLFWDGRANHFFNGRNIWGDTDTSGPTVLEKLFDGTLGEVAILLADAAAASQAIGPPLSETEMSWAGRTWEEVGRRMVNRGPLANQQVDLTDGVLGVLANPAGPGLQSGVTYADLIQAAFQERWWGSSELTAEGYTHMEANFSLFFGLAIQVYESTLVPDNAPYDQWALGDGEALGASERRGLELFVGIGQCINCHGGPLFAGGLRDDAVGVGGEGAIEFMPMGTTAIQGGVQFRGTTSAADPESRIGRSVAALYDSLGRLVAWARLPGDLNCAPAGQHILALEPTQLVPADADFDARVRVTSNGACGVNMEFGFSWNRNGPAPGRYVLRIANKRMRFNVFESSTAIYDNGFYNIGVSPTAEDLGVGGDGAFGPLSLSRRFQQGDDLGPNPGVTNLPWYSRVAVDGSFKVPTLRNIELTGPYMHNGGMASLEQVVEFYARGTDFGAANVEDLAPDVTGIPGLTEQNKDDLVAFLKTLTDPRVRFERAPFDHPQLIIKDGQVGNHSSVEKDASGNAVPFLVNKPATGAAGGAAIEAFVDGLHASITVTVLEEDSLGARIGLICDKKPEAPVTVRLRLSDPSIATLAPSSVTFWPHNWRTSHEAVIFTLDPGSAGGASLVLQTSSGQSADPEFDGLPVADVPLDFLPNLITNADGPGQTVGAPAPGGAGASGKRL